LRQGRQRREAALADHFDQLGAAIFGHDLLDHWQHTPRNLRQL
jgi:hypothetical protein